MQKQTKIENYEKIKTGKYEEEKERETERNAHTLQ